MRCQKKSVVNETECRHNVGTFQKGKQKPESLILIIAL